MRKLPKFFLLLSCLLAVCCTYREEAQPSPTFLPTEPPTATSTPSSTSTSAPIPTATRTPAPTFTSTPVPVLPPIRTPQSREELPPTGAVPFQILHWNDFHGELAERDYMGTWIPGAARLAYIVKQAEQAYGQDRTLILDTGDWLEGAPAALKSGGFKVLEFYQRLGVDAATAGNHEFFLGTPRFYQIVSQAAPLEILSVNLRKWGTQRSCSDVPIINAYQVFELGDPGGPVVRVAVIGAGRRYLEEEAYSTLVGICFSKPGEEILKMYDQMVEMEKPDVIVAISHSGLTDDRMLAEELNAAGKPVDIIIGGHGHTFMDAPAVIGKTTIVQAGERGRSVGVFDLVYQRASSRLEVKWRRADLKPCDPQDKDTLAFLADTVSTPTPGPAITKAKDPASTYLIDLEPTYAEVGYWTLGKGVFPALDMGMAECQVITSHAQPYPYGLFAHAPSELHYALEGQYSRFNTEISIKETACGDGAEFIVSLDGKEIYHSPHIQASTKPIPVSLDVAGGDDLRLITRAGSDMNCDWTIWGDPRLER